MQQKETNITRLGYSKKEASRETSLSIRMLDYYISNGVLKAHNYGSRVIIMGESLRRFMEHGPIPYKNVEDSSAKPMYRSSRVYDGGVE